MEIVLVLQNSDTVFDDDDLYEDSDTSNMENVALRFSIKVIPTKSYLDKKNYIEG